MHPRSKQWLLIDYVLVRQRDIRDVRFTKAMRGAEYWTDHRLIRATLNVHFARQATQGRPHCFQYSQTAQPFLCTEAAISPWAKLPTNGLLTGGPTQKWNRFRDIVKETAETTPGPKKDTRQDWCDENDSAIKDLFARKNDAFMEWQNDQGSAPRKDRFKSLQTQAQRKIRRMQDQWWEKKVEEVQCATGTNNTKQFFSSIKSVFGPSKTGIAPVLSPDGAALIKDKAGISSPLEGALQSAA